jgi:cathepsin C
LQNFNTAKTLKLNLNDDFKVTGNGNSGTWTMVYDVGFAIDHEDVDYFAYNKYLPD